MTEQDRRPRKDDAPPARKPSPGELAGEELEKASGGQADAQSPVVDDCGNTMCPCNPDWP